MKLKIEKIISGGRGLGHAQGKTIFVDGVIDGEIADVRITEQKKKFLSAFPLSIIKSSQYRITPPCPYHFSINRKNPPDECCGGCSLQHIDYKYQLTIKKKILAETLKHIGKIKNPPIQEIIFHCDVFRYRNKAQIPVATINNKIISGFFAPDSHRIIDMKDCLTQKEIVFKITNYVKNKLKTFGIKPYSEQEHTGSLRHIFIRVNLSGDVLVGFVTKNYIVEYEKLAVEIAREFPEIKGVVLNENPDRTNVIFGNIWKKLWGENQITEELDGAIKIRISNGSFFQVNTAVAKKIYTFVSGQFADGRFQNILDLYCGVGGFALSAHRHSDRIIGVEEDINSVADASVNAQINGIKNVQFFAQRVEDFLKKLPGIKNCGVIVDPPRSGLSSDAIFQLMRLSPAKIVYVSCDPSTFSRDAAIMVSKGYKLLSVQPFDMFPQTPHLELVGIFHKI